MSVTQTRIIIVSVLFFTLGVTTACAKPPVGTPVALEPINKPQRKVHHGLEQFNNPKKYILELDLSETSLALIDDEKFLGDEAKTLVYELISEHLAAGSIFYISAVNPLPENQAKAQIGIKEKSLILDVKNIPFVKNIVSIPQPLTVNHVKPDKSDPSYYYQPKLWTKQTGYEFLKTQFSKEEQLLWVAIDFWDKSPGTGWLREKPYFEAIKLIANGRPIKEPSISLRHQKAVYQELISEAQADQLFEHPLVSNIIPLMPKE